MKAIETHADGSKTFYLWPCVLGFILLNVVAAATVWLTVRIWDFVL